MCLTDGFRVAAPCFGALNVRARHANAFRWNRSAALQRNSLSFESGGVGGGVCARLLTMAEAFGGHFHDEWSQSSNLTLDEKRKFKRKEKLGEKKRKAAPLPPGDSLVDPRENIFYAVSIEF